MTRVEKVLRPCECKFDQRDLFFLRCILRKSSVLTSLCKNISPQIAISSEFPKGESSNDVTFVASTARDMLLCMYVCTVLFNVVRYEKNSDRLGYWSQRCGRGQVIYSADCPLVLLVPPTKLDGSVSLLSICPLHQTHTYYRSSTYCLTIKLERIIYQAT